MNDTFKEHTIWVEKYRPITLETYIGNEAFITKVKQWITSNDIPHLLFYGKTGTGKTTLAKLIVSSIKCDTIYINASAENGVESIRNKVTNFASTMGFSDLKVIILDEADFITLSGQAALRSVMETFSRSTRFILTCNYRERILEAISGRCQQFEIYPPAKKDVAATLIRILNAEGIKYDKESIVSIINAQYPDIRSTINNAQGSVIDGVLTVDKESVKSNDIKNKIVEMLKMPEKRDAFIMIRQLVNDNSIQRYEDFYTYLYEKVSEYAPTRMGQVILALADGQFQDVQVVDKELCFMATIYKILQIT